MKLNTSYFISIHQKSEIIACDLLMQCFYFLCNKISELQRPIFMLFLHDSVKSYDYLVELTDLLVNLQKISV